MIAAVLGILILALPGYLFSLLLFRKMDLIERICTSFAFTVFVLVLLSIMLTLLGNLTGKLNFSVLYVWIGLIIVSSTLGFLLYIRETRFASAN